MPGERIASAANRREVAAISMRHRRHARGKARVMSFARDFHESRLGEDLPPFAGAVLAKSLRLDYQCH